jgi:predicted ATP-grasp superfamily ATP-dependent carboligase
VCTIDFILKPVHPDLLSACVLAKVVVAKAELNNNIHPLYTCAAAAGTADEVVQQEMLNVFQL